MKCPRCGAENFYSGIFKEECENPYCDLHEAGRLSQEDEGFIHEMFFGASSLDELGRTHNIPRKRGEADSVYKRRIFDIVSKPAKR